MPDNVQFSWIDPQGKRIRTARDIISAQWVRTTNNLGSARIEVSAKSYDFATFTRQDLGLLIESGTPLVPDLGTFWFLRGFSESKTQKAETIVLQFEDAMSLLSRRVVSLSADDPRGSEPRTRLEGPANREVSNLVSDVVSLSSFNRFWGNNFSSAPVITPAPNVSLEVPYKNLLQVCQKVARVSRDKGTPLFFDVIYSPPYNFAFTTYTGQRGRLHTEVINTEHPSFVLDSFGVSYNIPNTGYVGGSGKGDARKIGFAQNEVSNQSIFGIYEQFKSTNINDQSALDDEAREIVNLASGKVALSGKLLGDLAGKYQWGDRVTVSHRSFSVQCEIATVATNLNNDIVDRNVVIRSIEA